MVDLFMEQQTLMELGEVINWDQLKGYQNTANKIDNLNDIDFDLKSLAVTQPNQKGGGVMLTELDLEKSFWGNP